ncbi:hypothetical protein SynMVIR181_01436 [Synechococcus sp. MVIR-18-1]|nr:hypothetical protein SynMVIR181_01436 [Synechococcus sp. MVIR-18-1]
MRCRISVDSSDALVICTGAQNIVFCPWITRASFTENRTPRPIFISLQCNLLN